MSPYEALKVVFRGEVGEETASSWIATIEEMYTDEEQRLAALQKQLAQRAEQARARREEEESQRAWKEGRPRSVPPRAAPPAPVAPAELPEPEEEEAPRRQTFVEAVLNALFRTPVLDTEDKVIVCCLLTFRGSRRGIYPSLDTIAARTGLSRATVQRRVRQAEGRPGGLRDRGILTARPGPAPVGAVGPGATLRYVVRHPKHWRLHGEGGDQADHGG